MARIQTIVYVEEGDTELQAALMKLLETDGFDYKAPEMLDEEE